MKVLYIAGPFRGGGSWDIEQNVRKAEKIALELWNLGFAVICPHTNTRFFDKAIDDDSVWLDGDSEIMSRCDAIVTVPGWEKSVGATSEVSKANGKPVFHWTFDKDFETAQKELMVRFRDDKELEIE